MKNVPEKIFHKKIKTYDSILILQGKIIKKNKYYFPSPDSDILFMPNSITISTAPFDEKIKLELIIFRGNPQDDYNKREHFRVTGVIEVDKSGIKLVVGDEDFVLSSFSHGMVNIVIDFDKSEIFNNNVRTYKIYINPLVKKKSVLRIK